MWTMNNFFKHTEVEIAGKVCACYKNNTSKTFCFNLQDYFTNFVEKFKLCLL